MPDRANCACNNALGRARPSAMLFANRSSFPGRFVFSRGANSRPDSPNSIIFRFLLPYAIRTTLEERLAVFNSRSIPSINESCVEFLNLERSGTRSIPGGLLKILRTGTEKRNFAQSNGQRDSVRDKLPLSVDDPASVRKAGAIVSDSRLLKTREKKRKKKEGKSSRATIA